MVKRTEQIFIKPSKTENETEWVNAVHRLAWEKLRQDTNPVCGTIWKQRMYPMTQGMLPVSVLVCGTDSEFRIGQVTSMAYTYLLN